MGNVKLTEKDLLERLQARILLLGGDKITQQDLLDKCIRFIDKNFDLFIAEQIKSPRLTEKKIKNILKNTIQSGFKYLEKTDDELLYG